MEFTFDETLDQDPIMVTNHDGELQEKIDDHTYTLIELVQIKSTPTTTNRKRMTQTRRLENSLKINQTLLKIL